MDPGKKNTILQMHMTCWKRKCLYFLESRVGLNNIHGKKIPNAFDFRRQPNPTVPGRFTLPVIVILVYMHIADTDRPGGFFRTSVQERQVLLIR